MIYTLTHTYTDAHTHTHTHTHIHTIGTKILFLMETNLVKYADLQNNHASTPLPLTALDWNNACVGNTNNRVPKINIIWKPTNLSIRVYVCGCVCVCMYVCVCVCGIPYIRPRMPSCPDGGI